jgi:hypothetical protein
MADHPIEAQIMMLAGARASVPPSRLPDLVETAQSYIRDQRAE